MREFRFNLTDEFPIVRVRLHGPRNRGTLRMVFDTGAGFTQIHTAAMETFGFSAAIASHLISAHGPAGQIQEGYLVTAPKIEVFGKQFENAPIGVYDFDHFERIGLHGLLGWDISRKLRLEMDGPAGVLRVH